MIGKRSRLTIFVAAVILLPALISHLVPARRDFDPKPIARLRHRQPEVVLIGDSVLGGAINSSLFASKTGMRDVELLWNGGAASAAWYLLLKNYVVASGIHPRLVCIFFRERMLTDATFRTTPTYRRFLGVDPAREGAGLSGHPARVTRRKRKARLAASSTGSTR